MVIVVAVVIVLLLFFGTFVNDPMAVAEFLRATGRVTSFGNAKQMLLLRSHKTRSTNPR
jgi:hypothetical protein